jgi:hypothetical protein
MLIGGILGFVFREKVTQTMKQVSNYILDKTLLSKTD